MGDNESVKSETDAFWSVLQTYFFGLDIEKEKDNFTTHVNDYIKNPISNPPVKQTSTHVKQNQLPPPPDKNTPPPLDKNTPSPLDKNTSSPLDENITPPVPPISTKYTPNNYKNEADEIRAKIRLLLDNSGFKTFMTQNRDTERFVTEIQKFVFEKDNIERCLSFCYELYETTDNNRRLELVSDLFSNEEIIGGLLNNTEVLKLVDECNKLSPYTKFIDMGVSAFLNDDDIAPIKPQLLHLFAVLSKVIRLLTGKTYEPSTFKPGFIQRGLNSGFRHTAYPIAKTVVIAIPVVSGPYGIYKTMVSSGTIAKSMISANILLSIIDEKLDESEESEFIQRIRDIYKKSPNFTKYNNFIEFLYGVVLHNMTDYQPAPLPSVSDVFVTSVPSININPMSQSSVARSEGGCRKRTRKKRKTKTKTIKKRRKCMWKCK